MKNKKKAQRSRTKVIIPVIVVAAVVGTSSVAKANFLNNLLNGITGSNGGAVSSIFQSLSSGSFNFNNLSQVISGVTNSILSPTSSGLGTFSSTGGFAGPLTNGSGGSIGGLSGNISPATTQKITNSATYIQNLYGSISQGNLNGILNNGIGLLNALGIGLPSQTTATSGSAGSPLGNGGTGVTSNIPSIDDELITAKEPFDIWQAGNKKQSIYPTANYNISQISLGKEGQDLSAAQSAERIVSVSSAQEATADVAQYVSDGAELNNAVDKAAQSGANLAEACSADKQSLDCLKKISGGLAVLSGQNSLISAGQTLQIAATFQNSEIGAANAALAKINGDLLQKVEIQTAATNNGVTVLAGLADQEHQYQLTQDQADLRFLTKTQGSFIVPGLFK